MSKKELSLLTEDGSYSFFGEEFADQYTKTGTGKFIEDDEEDEEEEE